MLKLASEELERDTRDFFNSFKDLTEEAMHVQLGPWGTWKPWVIASNENMKICGARMKFEEQQRFGDETAANGLDVKYCDTTGGIWGE